MVFGVWSQDPGLGSRFSFFRLRVAASRVGSKFRISGFGFRVAGSRVAFEVEAEEVQDGFVKLAIQHDFLVLLDELF